MKWLCYFLAIVWSVTFILFILGAYEPKVVEIGGAFLMTILYLVRIGREAE